MSAAEGLPPLVADATEMRTFLSALFRHADEGTFVSLRGFSQHDRGLPPILIDAHAIGRNGADLAEVAAKAADTVCARGGVFAPPVCTFKGSDKAREQDIANGVALSVDLDDRNPTEARTTLEWVLGTATLVMASGSIWTEAETGELHPKLHIHWRLSEPTRTYADHVKLKKARLLAAQLVGGDETAATPCHPLRMAGSWNTKNKPTMARIIVCDEQREIDLDDALQRLQEACDARGINHRAERGEGTKRTLSERSGPIDRIASAMAAIPNSGIEWSEWNRIGMALWAATGGSEEGLQIWDEWSRQSPKNGAKDSCRARWSHYISHPPTTVGAHTIFAKASEQGWMRFAMFAGASETAEGGGEGDETATTDDDRENDPEPGKATSGKSIIRVRAGELDLLATKGEAALCSSGLPIYQRGDVLVRPISKEVSASRGRTTVAAGLSELSTPAMLDLLSQSATWVRYDKRAKAEVACDPPSVVPAIILSRNGQWKLPVVAGVITTPTLRPNGSILSEQGYDTATHLYHVSDPGLRLVAMPEKPTRDDALEALGNLKALLVGFPFVTEVDRAVALSGLITPVVRGALNVVPLHGFRASTAGSGKSYLVDITSAIATGRPCPVVAAGQTDEETEKRLVGLMIAGFPIVSIDNVNGEIGGDFLCQMIERPLVSVRPLGTSEHMEIESRATVFATGNGLRVRGDMTRRSLVASLDSQLERPELREFSSNPLQDVLADRGKFVAACLTIVRAYTSAGRPALLPPLGSFEDWSDSVRSALVWLGCEDPVISMEAAREEDPDLVEHREFLAMWAEHMGTGPDYRFTARDLADAASRREASRFGEVSSEFAAPEFRDVLLRIAGDRGNINTRRLGAWLTNHAGRIVDGLRVVKGSADRNGIVKWTVVAASK